MIFTIKVLLVLLSFGYFAASILLGYDFVKDIYKASGQLALIFLFLSIVLPNRFIIFIKFFGKLSGFYAILHFLNFIILDNQFVLKDLLYNILAIRNLLGFIAFVFMVLMFFKKYLNYSNFVFLLLAFHYSLSVKIPETLHYLVIFIAFLLLFRSKSDIRKN